MLQNISVAWSLATFPVRALYAGYRALAWAFDAPGGDAVRRPGAAGVEGVVGTRRDQPAKAPDDCGHVDVGADHGAAGLPDKARERLLKLGFVSSTLMWVPAAYGAAVAHRLDWVSEPRAWMGFAWAAAAAWIVSVLAIRRAGRREAAARAASPLGRARRTIGGVLGAAVDMPRRVVAGARAVPERAAGAVRGVPERAACAARGAAERVGGGARRVIERARERVAMWAGGRRVAPLGSDDARQ